MKPTLEEFKNDCRICVLWQGRKSDIWFYADFDIDGTLLQTDSVSPNPKNVEATQESVVRHHSGIETEVTLEFSLDGIGGLVVSNNEVLPGVVEGLYHKFSRRYDIMSAAGMSHEEIMETIGSI